MRIPVELGIAIVQGVVKIAQFLFRPKKKTKITKRKHKEVQTFETETTTDPELLDNTIHQPNK